MYSIMVNKYTIMKRRMAKILWRVGIKNRRHFAFTIIGFVLLMFVTRWLLSSGKSAPEVPSSGQDVLDYISRHVKVRVSVVDNIAGQPIQLSLSNEGNVDIVQGGWRIYFNNLVGHFPGVLDCGLTLAHVNGGLYYISPKLSAPLKAGTRLSCSVRHRGAAISKSDFYPNWYVWYPREGMVPRVVENTRDETMSFIGPFNKPMLWKRSSNDRYNPFTPEERFRMNEKVTDAYSDLPRIVPSPELVSKLSESTIIFDESWKIAKSVQFPSIVSFLSSSLRRSVTGSENDCSKCILFKYGDGRFGEEEYKLNVDPTEEHIVISAQNQAGAFYGAQTLIALVNQDRTIPHISIEDKPRFEYRGLMIDVARNFQSKETIMQLIDIMSVYKLNRLHLHLNDDEGWRLEIPSIPELTRVGSRRCHKFASSECLIPSLGSGPTSDTSGSGFYTVTDYREIIRYASERFVQVVPEIDMPGHSLAAVTAMRYRSDHLAGTSETLYPLDEKDSTKDESLNNYFGNVVNPCLNSTYQFLEVIMNTLIRLHKGVHDLQTFHFGGDEVSSSAWQSSKACKGIGKTDNPSIMRHFVENVADLAYKKGLNIAAWEDGMYNNEGPYRRHQFRNKEVFAYPWKNIWELGTASRAVYFANMGFKVVLAMATHLYLDHPYEPDPEERGLYWATRYTDTARVFGFMPNRIYDNADVFADGNQVDIKQYCARHECPTTTHPENIIGIQACLWGETTRRREHVHEMLFPRLLAVAERAWHKGTWEDIPDIDKRNAEKRKDWSAFTGVLGKFELPRLEKMGIQYRVPIPGARADMSRGVLEVNTMYPNHRVFVSFNAGEWISVSDSVKIPSGAKVITVKAKSAHTGRESREVRLSL